MSALARRIGRLTPKSSLFFLCDMQTVFRNDIYQMPSVIQGTNALLSAVKTLEIPVLVTTQYAARLGDTLPEIAQHFDGADVSIYDKKIFSMLTKDVEQYLEGHKDRKSVVLCGIEGHVCVLQTCLDLLDRGYDVHVVADAVSSSTSFNRKMSLERMRQSGAFITSVESSIFQLTGDSAHPKFRTISNIIKEHRKAENAFEDSL